MEEKDRQAGAGKEDGQEKIPLFTTHPVDLGEPIPFLVVWADIFLLSLVGIDSLNKEKEQEQDMGNSGDG